MAAKFSLSRVLVSTIMFLVFVNGATAGGGGPVKFFDVTSYGAKGDGKTDNSQAFLKTWKDACEFKGKARFLIPKGTYLLGPVLFVGKCNGLVTMILKGKLIAPEGLPSVNDHWITFRYVDSLIINGGGVVDGQGHTAWPYNDCMKNPKCQQLPISLRFEFVNNAKVRRIQSINSKNGHFHLFGCTNFNISNVKISAPGDSPNTDGIKVGSSNRILIEHTEISTGDDCVAILPGTKGLDIFNVTCGPGHGISIGSLGRNPNEGDVTGVSVRDSSFNNTISGLRIKTWASPYSSTVSDITYDNIEMNSVENPIIIEQNYCPSRSCDVKAQSHVEVKDVKYYNIRGGSTQETAVTFKCSKIVPCKGVELRDINLWYQGPGKKRVTSLCENSYGHSSGQQKPTACLSR
ncbi:hypothetical protein ACFE04_011365 [Oxalis oulophora]